MKDRRYYLVYETGTDDYACGPFDSRESAQRYAESMGDVEGQEQGQFIIVPHSKMPKRILRKVAEITEVARMTRHTLPAKPLGEVRA